jgi:hypothetical protein
VTDTSPPAAPPEWFCPLCAETHPCRRHVNEQLTFALETLEVYATSLKDRVAVENELRAIGAGKAPLPTRGQCLEMARRLGVPARVREAFDRMEEASSA